MELISVIIPIYNQAHTLERCLGTVVWLSYNQPLEVIIVNDGSTDDFAVVLEKILEKYPDVKALNIKVINQSNQGAPSARNHGFSESSGKYVIFIDADTICYPNMLVEMKTQLEKNPTAAFAYSQFRFGWKKIKSHQFDVELLGKYNYIDVTSLIRRDAVVPFDEKLKRFQDWDLWLTLASRGKSGIFIPKVLYKKITNPIGISSWFPSFFFNLPWKTRKIEKYESAAKIVRQKHGLS